MLSRGGPTSWPNCAALLRRLDQVEIIALRRYLTESVSVPLTG